MNRYIKRKHLSRRQLVIIRLRKCGFNLKYLERQTNHHLEVLLNEMYQIRKEMLDTLYSKVKRQNYLAQLQRDLQCGRNGDYVMPCAQYSLKPRIKLEFGLSELRDMATEMVINHGNQEAADFLHLTRNYTWNQ